MTVRPPIGDEPAPPTKPPCEGGGLAGLLAEDLDGGFEELVVIHQHALFAFALGLAREPARAEDLVQDSLVRAYRALRRYPAERIRSMAVRAWLMKIVLNTFRNSVRRRGAEILLVADPPAVTSLAEGPEDAVMRASDRDRLLGALAELPLPHRAAVVLRYAHDLGYSEVAAVMGRPEGTVKSDVHRALAALRSALGESAAGGEEV
ncbi:MAG: RNA polymerase sigma factor [Candidatus Dormibacterales bacterium]